MTTEQRDSARRRADEVRCGNAEQYRTIRAMKPEGALAVAAAILRQPHEREGSMQIGALLRAIPGIGPMKTLDLLTRVHVHGRVHLAKVNELQRDHLAKLLDQRRSNLNG